MSEFEKLLAELSQETQNQEALAKSLAVAPGADQTIAGAIDGAKPNPEDNVDEDALTKSLDAAAQAAGVSMIDGEDFAKSLADLGGRLTGAENVLASGLQSALGLIRGQNDMIKSMQEQIHDLSGQGRGRKTMLTVSERQPVGEPLAKSQSVTVVELMAKANSAWDAKKITGQELTSLDVALRNGQVPSEAVLTKILS